MRALLYGFAAALFILGGVLPTHAEERPLLQLDTGGHQGTINGVAFSPDAKFIISAGYDKVIRVWDWRKGKICSNHSRTIGCGARRLDLRNGAVARRALASGGRVDR